MKWVIWVLLLISPAGMSWRGGYTLGQGLILPLLVLVLGSLVARKAHLSREAEVAALVAIAGGALGVMVGAVAGVLGGYWAGAVSGAALAVAGLVVAAVARRSSPDGPLTPAA